MIKIGRLNEQTTIDQRDKFKGQSRPVLRVDHWVLINSLGGDQLLVLACRRLRALRFDFNRTLSFVRYFQTPVKMFSFVWRLCECLSSIKTCYKDDLRLFSFRTTENQFTGAADWRRNKLQIQREAVCRMTFLTSLCSSFNWIWHEFSFFYYKMTRWS